MVFCYVGAQVVNTVNSSMETPLHIACMVNNAKGVQVLYIELFLKHKMCLNSSGSHTHIEIQGIILIPSRGPIVDDEFSQLFLA